MNSRLSMMISGGMIVLGFLGFGHFLTTISPSEALENTDSLNFVISLDDQISCGNDRIHKWKPLQKSFGIISPHHLLVEDMMHEIFAKASDRGKPDAIILLAPNHFERGSNDVITTDLHWQTGNGKIMLENKIFSSFSKLSFVENNKEVLENDHSITALLPFIACYYPDVPVVPMVLRHEMSENNINKLVDEFVPLVSEKNILVLGSVDFSHYLSTSEAYEKDEITKSIIFDRNYNQILKMGVDHYDSAPTVYAMLKLMDASENANSTIIRHQNIGDVVGREVSESTSYFTYIFD